MDYMEKIKKIEVLKSSFSEDSIKQLISYFGDNYWPVRKKASEAIESFKNKAIKYLRDTAKTTQDDDIFYWCVRTLGNLKEGFTALAELLDMYDNVPHKIWIIEAIGETKNPEAISRLISLFGHNIWNIRQAAAQAIKKFGKLSIPALKQAFSDNDSNKKYWAIKLLSQILKEKMVPALDEILKSKDKTLRYHAIIALSEINHDFTIPPLINALDDESWINRRQAAYALEQKGDRAVSYLKSAFITGSSDTKFWIIKIMARVLKSKSLTFMEPLLKSENEEMRYYAVTALGEIKSKKSANLLIRAFTDPSWIIRNHAANQLIQLGEVAIKTIESEKIFVSDNEDILYWTIQVLAELGEVNILIDAFNKQKKQIRIYIVNALQKIETKKAIKALIIALDDKAWPVRHEATNSLLSFGNRAIEYIITSFPDDIAISQNMQFWLSRILNEYKTILQKFIRKAFKSDNEILCQKCIQVAKCLRSKSFVGFLIDYWQEASSTEMDYINKLLFEYIKEFFEYIINSLKPVNAAKKLKYIELLKTYPVEPTLIYLKPFINDENATVRFEAMKAISSVNTPQAINMLIEILETNNESECKFVVSALKQNTEREFLHKIVEYMNSESDDVALWLLNYIMAVSNIHPEEIVKIFHESNNRIKVFLTKVVGTLRHPLFVDAVIAELENPETPIEIKAELIKCLGKTEDERMVEPLVAILESNVNENIGRLVLSALEKIENKFPLLQLMSELNFEKSYVQKWLDNQINALPKELKQKLIDKTPFEKQHVKVMKNIKEYIKAAPLSELMATPIDEIIQLLATATKISTGYIQSFIADYGKEYVIRAAKDCVGKKNFEALKNRDSWFQQVIETIRGLSGIKKKKKQKFRRIVPPAGHNN